jgi:hypothetical protein
MRRVLPYLLPFGMGLGLSACDRPSEPGLKPPSVAVPSAAVKDAPLPSSPAKTVAAALAAAADPTGATPCERAYDGLTTMRATAARAQLGSEPTPLPPRERFVTTCSALPPEVQKCLELRQAVAHVKECQDAVARLDSAAQQRLQQLLGK